MPKIKFSFLALIVTSLLFIALGCGKKANLYIPTEEQQKTIQENQLQRDIILKNRNQL